VIVIGARLWEGDIAGVVDGAPILPVLPLVQQHEALGDLTPHLPRVGAQLG